MASFIVAAEYTRKRTIERYNRTVENTVGGWDQVARDDRVAAVAPDNITVSGRPGLPREYWEEQKVVLMVSLTFLRGIDWRNYTSLPLKSSIILSNLLILIFMDKND